MREDTVALLLPDLPRQGARALPWLSVVGGSAVTAMIPLVATVPLMPPFGLLLLLAWRLLARFALRRWAAAPLGFADDLVSGQPLGSSVLLWSICFLLIDLAEQRLVFRDLWQDWSIAAGLIAMCLLLGRVIAVPIGAHVDTALVAQIAVAILLFPAASRIVAWIDLKRAYP